jgi:V/A-type H+/Na+-transporting ATPase subunit I
VIEKVSKILIAGSQKEKETVIKELQKAGVIEIEPYKGELFDIDGSTVSTYWTSKISVVLKIVQKYENIVKKNNIEPKPFPGERDEIIEEIPKLDATLKRLQEEQVILKNKMAFLNPWGNFSLDQLKKIEEAGNLVIQFWDVSLKVVDEVKVENVIAEIPVGVDDQRRYFMTFAKEPVKIAQCVEVNYDRDMNDMKQELLDFENKEKELKEKLYSTVSRIEDLKKYYFEAMDEVNFDKAVSGSITHFDETLFIIQGWCPDKEMNSLKKVLEKFTATIIPVKPEKDERIPTLLESNNKPQELGSDLVNIYDVPSYNDWDPSAWVFFAFTIFFAMILADGGYGILLLAVMIYLKIKVKNPSPVIKRFINLSLVLTGSTSIYGLVSGGFFGLSIESPAFSWMKPLTGLLESIRLFDSTDTALMMMVSIIIGMLHISLSLVLKGLRSIIDDKDYITPAINLVWIAGIWAFFFWYKYDGVEGYEAYTNGGLTGLKICGGLLVVLYAVSARTLNPLKMFMSSFFGLYNGVQFFSDVLSYIRIFALGLSGALLAQTFNDLSLGLWESGPGGMIFAPVIFVLGHTLNIALCIMGGVIHGLRLNFLEWYRWSFDGGGRKFTPFKDLLNTYIEKNV